VQEAIRTPPAIPTTNPNGSSSPSSTQLPPSMIPKIKLPAGIGGRNTGQNTGQNRQDPNSTDTSGQSPIGIPTGTSVEEYRRADEYLQQLAIRTGGRVNLASSKENMAFAFSKIADELRQYYTLGYYPLNETDTGKKRRIKVKVNREKVVVRTRDSYILGDKKRKKK
jgi:VWFA-related protein